MSCFSRRILLMDEGSPRGRGRDALLPKLTIAKEDGRIVVLKASYYMSEELLNFFHEVDFGKKKNEENFTYFARCVWFSQQHHNPKFKVIQKGKKLHLIDQARNVNIRESFS